MTPMRTVLRGCAPGSLLFQHREKKEKKKVLGARQIKKKKKVLQQGGKNIMTNTLGGRHIGTWKEA